MRMKSRKQLTMALALTLALGGSVPVWAAVQSGPLVVTEKGQTVTDDFDVKDCGNQAVLEIYCCR